MENENFFEHLVHVLEHSLYEIGVFVVLSLFIYLFLKDKILRHLKRNNYVWLGSTLGAIPGCGGAISVAIFYLQKVFAAGVLVAAMVATMGDGAFVLLATKPLTFLLVIGVAIPLSLVLGYLTNYFKWFKVNIKEVKTADNIKLLSEVKTKNIFNSFLAKWGHYIFLVIMVLAMIVKTGDYINVAFPEWLTLSLFVLAYLLVIWNFIYAGINKICIHHVEDKCHKRKLEDLFRKSSHILFYIAAGIIVFELIQHYFLEIDSLTSITNQVLLIVVFGLIGFIPGSGTQIVVTSLFLKGLLSFPILLANALVASGEVGYLLLKDNKKNLLKINTLIYVFAILISFAFLFIKI